MKRIFFNGSLTEQIVLEGDNFHYLKNVVRVKDGDTLGVLSAEKFAVCSIKEIGKKNALLKAETIRDIVRHRYRLKIYQCLLKREYMDFAVEKYSELGATEIVPVISRFSLNELKDKTKERFSDIAVRAVLQSENEELPEISDSMKIEDVTADSDTNIMFYERCPEKSMPSVSKNMSIIIGPEGGFAPDEAELLTAKGFLPVRPIEQILKAETAAVVFTGYIRMAQDNL